MWLDDDHISIPIIGSTFDLAAKRNIVQRTIHCRVFYPKVYERRTPMQLGKICFEQGCMVIV